MAPNKSEQIQNTVTMLLLRQIVNLQTNRICSSSLDRVNHFYYFAIGQRSGCLHEYSLFYAFGVRQIRSGLHTSLISVIRFALLERLLKFGGERSGIVYGTHCVRIQLELKIGSD